MNNRIYKVVGRVLRANRKTGIHGLLIEVFDKDCKFLDHLGSVRTRRDGSFSIIYRESDFADLFEQKPSLYIRVRDRDNKLIYTHKKTHRFQPGGIARYNIALPNKVLTNHFSRPVSWERTGDRLLPREKLNQIKQAVSLLATPGTPEHAVFLTAAWCPLPPIDGFSNLIEDAWKVLNGDIAASIRLRDMLELIYGVSIHRDPDRVKQFSEEISNLLGDEAFGNKPVHLDKSITGFPESEPFIDTNAAVPLILASMYVGNGNPLMAQRYLEITLGQINGYCHVATIYRAAGLALRGGSKGIEFFRNVLGLMGECGPDDRPIPTCPIPVPEYECVISAGKQFRRNSPYTIESVNPVTACTGTIITISGNNFGDDVGSVRFSREPSGYTFIDVEPESWSDTEITVPVPEEAGCSSISLIVPIGSIEVCDRFIDIPGSPGNSIHFEGALPVIFSFTINGQTEETVSSCDELALSWQVCNATTIHLQRTSAVGPSVDIENPSSNEYSLGLYRDEGPADATYELIASNDCGTVTRSVSIHKCAPPIATLTTIGLDPEITVVSGTESPRSQSVDTHRFTLRAIGEDNCGVRNIRIGGAVSYHCIKEGVGVAETFEIRAENPDYGSPGDTGLIERTIEWDFDINHFRCPRDYSRHGVMTIWVSATVENFCNETATVEFRFYI